MTTLFSLISDEWFYFELGRIWTFDSLPISSALIGLGGWLCFVTILLSKMLSEILSVGPSLVDTGITWDCTTSLDD